MTRFSTPRQIIQFVGRDAAAEALGVAPRRIDRAVCEAQLPAMWLDELEKLARQPLPRNLFTFKRAESAA